MRANKQKDFKPPKPGRGIPEGMRVFLDEQKAAFLPDVHLEVLENSQAVVEGCKGVLAYSSELIRLGCGRRILSFSGSGLELRCLSASTAVVTGTIDEIRYEG